VVEFSAPCPSETPTGRVSSGSFQYLLGVTKVNPLFTHRSGILRSFSFEIRKRRNSTVTSRCRPALAERRARDQDFPVFVIFLDSLIVEGIGMGRQLIAMGMGIMPGRKRRFCLWVMCSVRIRVIHGMVLFPHIIGTVPAGSIRRLFCDRYFNQDRGISRVLRHRRGFHDTLFPATGTGRLPGQLVMIAGGFIDDMVFSIALRAGEPDDIPGSCAGDFRFYGGFYHRCIDLVIVSG
jgi:hypothetical protein